MLTGRQPDDHGQAGGGQGRDRRHDAHGPRPHGLVEDQQGECAGEPRGRTESEIAGHERAPDDGDEHDQQQRADRLREERHPDHGRMAGREAAEEVAGAIAGGGEEREEDAHGRRQSGAAPVPIYGLGVAAPPADPPPAAEAPTHQDPADQLAIERLLRTYARRIDAGDFAGVGALFALGTIAT